MVRVVLVACPLGLALAGMDLNVNVTHTRFRFLLRYPDAWSRVLRSWMTVELWDMG